MSLSRARSAAVTLILLCLIMVSPGRALGVVNGTEVPCDDRRFDAVGLFMVAGDNPWSTCGGGISGTCTLVDSRTILFARHSLGISQLDPLPNPQQSFYRVRFRRAASGAAWNYLLLNGVWCHGVYQEILVQALFEIPGSDLCMGILETAPVGIAPISVELSNPPVRDTEIILAGWGYRGECMASGPAYTLSMARGGLPDQGGVTPYLIYSPCSIINTEPCRICPPGQWVSGNLHDSGAPVLYEVTDFSGERQLRLIGVVNSTSAATRPSVWNDSYAWPPLYEVQARKQADFNVDRQVNIADVFDYLNAYFDGSCLADYNHDGSVDTIDALTFVNDFFVDQ
jgi:hypothetical protein